MHIELLYKIEYVCWITKGLGMEQALTLPEVKILFDDSTSFDEMRWTIILPEKPKSWILYMTWWILYMTNKTKHLCVLIHIWAKGETCAPLNRFKPSSKLFLLTVPRRCFFCGSFMLFLSSFIMLSFTSVCWCLVVTCWERADLLALDV